MQSVHLAHEQGRRRRAYSTLHAGILGTRAVAEEVLGTHCIGLSHHTRLMQRGNGEAHCGCNERGVAGEELPAADQHHEQTEGKAEGALRMHAWSRHAWYCISCLAEQMMLAHHILHTVT